MCYMHTYYIGAEFARGRVCGGRVCQGPSLSGAEFVRGRDVQKPSSPPGFTCWISFALVFSFIYC